jgi:hypothetical protein
LKQVQVKYITTIQEGAFKHAIVKDNNKVENKQTHTTNRRKPKMTFADCKFSHDIWVGGKFDEWKESKRELN